MSVKKLSENPAFKKLNSVQQRHSFLIKQQATSLGFSFCGISKAEFLKDEAPKVEEWLKRKYQGKMSYLENYFDKRMDPTLLVPGAKSVISLIYNYSPSKDLADIAPKDPIFKFAFYI